MTTTRRKTRHPFDRLEAALCEYLAYRGWRASIVPGSAIGLIVDGEPSAAGVARRLKVVIEILGTKEH